MVIQLGLTVVPLIPEVPEARAKAALKAAHEARAAQAAAQQRVAKAFANYLAARTSRKEVTQ